MKKVIVIAESSWDIECIEKQGFEIEKKLLHNDYFSSKSNTESTKKIQRAISTIKIFIFILFHLFKKEKILFSSFNFECLFSAWIFSRKKNTYLFCSNVMTDPIQYNDIAHRRLSYLMKIYKNKIYVTDQVTIETLKEYLPIRTKNYFTFKTPPSHLIRDITYIIVLPAVLSHNQTKKNSDKYYQHSLYILKKLETYNLKYKILPHPREEGKINNINFIEYKNNFISREEIKNLGEYICYLSSYSSLSLNKRYGGNYGFWVKVPNINILPPDFSEKLLFDMDILDEQF
ncbi:hypothetical protein [Providencia sp. PROV118]|uniref:hypothetical protein n=1 Tax=Providencia sp. PROV118 TaxID=2949829 RepID=UPI00234AEA4F|nr:hypothetical protein [Providencia sp. PROV118]